MRITNKIMQNNSLYNINNNKIAEDQLNTMMSTGKKITKPSDDPVIAIRALRLRSNVTQIEQFYEKNAKDAKSWLDVTADALSTVTSVLTDCVKQATKGANKDLTLDDLGTIITQMDALSKEYYSTGNVDYAGRYVFTGYRTDTALTFSTRSTEDYRDINDEFNGKDVSGAKRILGKHQFDNVGEDEILQSSINEVEVGRIRLSYDTLCYPGDGSSDDVVELKWREAITQPASSTVDKTHQVIDLTFKTAEGVTHSMTIPVPDVDDNETYVITAEDGFTYEATYLGNNEYKIEVEDSGTVYEMMVKSDGTFYSTDTKVDSGKTTVTTAQRTTIKYTGEDGVQTEMGLPLIPAIGQYYTMTMKQNGQETLVTVNSDGTYTLADSKVTENDDGTTSRYIVQVTENGSIHSSYKETTLAINSTNILVATDKEDKKDSAYKNLVDGVEMAYLDAATGEILLNDELRNKLATLPDLINANTIDVVYNKKEWNAGDIRPENLFSCVYINSNAQEIHYNKGNAAHDIAYDVGFAQSVVVNTTADAVFTTSVKRDIDDLSKMLSELEQMASTIKIIKDDLSKATSDADKNRLTVSLEAANKAYDTLREELQKEFEHKITSMQKALDTANLAVTDNGTRSKRLDLIDARLMGQTTTFKTLQSENEDIDLATTVTQLTSAQVTYEASLMATGKISQSSLINYI
ncbi:hypothetical protein [Butyrivibrio proteoclasticus]|uniref:flagellin N-terminal helical domain-containing protein n=1 Tax=Butyrivibrio proteoclasticus TaxID=43305 RepID=UPI000687CE19|nr:hypothetical protein [Butyrivibrio proteoclasticus]